MKKFFLGLMAIMVSVTLFAAPRTMEEAAQIAAQFTNQQPRLRMAHKSPRAAANMRLAHKALQNDSENAAFYVFNQEGNNGFVIVSADDRTSEDVLGYTENGSFDMNTANPNLKWWLERYTKEITALQLMDDSELEPRKAVQVTAIAPLLVNQNGVEITWNQGTPYNNLCPIDEYNNQRSLTGCVATAASQIMYFWRWPEQGTGSSSYTWANCIAYDEDDNCTSSKNKTVSADYCLTIYDWDNMLPAYVGKSSTSAQKTAVATIMNHAGVAAEMSYAAASSGAWTDYMAYGLMTHFDYTFDKFITTMSDEPYPAGYGEAHDGVPAEFNVTIEQMTAYFNADLEAGRPILMGGDSEEWGGHEFVCCGRDTQNKFYINWGWEGEENGYFALSTLNPRYDNTQRFNFSENIDAIIGLQPKQNPDPVTVTWSVEGITSTTQVIPGKGAIPQTTPADCNCGKKFMGWTTQSSITDGAKPTDLFTIGKEVNAETTFYAVFAEEQEGQGEAAFDGVTSGTYKIYADVDGSKYYATTVSNNKLQSTTNEASATEFTFTKVNGGFTIKNGSNYIKHGSGTNINNNTNAYTWSVESGVNGTWRLASQTSGRALVFRASTYNVFGGYATSNITASGTEYYDLEIGGQGGTTYSNYALTCGCSPSAIDNAEVAPKAVKVLENGQIVIIRDNEKYTIFGQKIQ